MIVVQYRALCGVWDGCCPDRTAVVDWVLNTKLLEMGERERLRGREVLGVDTDTV